MTRNYEAELAALRHRYIASLPEKLARLSAAMQDARDSGTTIEALMLAHRLASTARLHGLAVLAARAGALADGLAALTDHASAMEWSELRRLLSGALDDAAKALGEAARAA